MKIVVFGATGTIGRQVVEQALQRGHDVTAFVRDPAKVQCSDVRAVQGDVHDAAAVRTAVQGQEIGRASCRERV